MSYEQAHGAQKAMNLSEEACPHMETCLYTAPAYTARQPIYAA